MVTYACAFSQSESGKYFEWIIIFLFVSPGINTVAVILDGFFNDLQHKLRQERAINHVFHSTRKQ